MNQVRLTTVPPYLVAQDGECCCQKPTAPAMLRAIPRVRKEARESRRGARKTARRPLPGEGPGALPRTDRKSTRLNSSHGYISYAVFCLKKKKKKKKTDNKILVTPSDT